MDNTQQVSLARILSYIKNKLATTNVNNNRSHGGAVLLMSTNGWQDKLDSLITTSFVMLQTAFNKSDLENVVGQTRLTSTCSSIGKTLSVMLGYKDLKWQAHCRVGSLFLEAYLQCGYIKIYRDKGYSEFDNQAPYIIEAAEGWAKLEPELGSSVLSATTDSEIETESMDAVKTNNIDVQLSVYKEREAPYKKAFYNLQNVSWKINSEMFDIILENEDHFTNPNIKLYTESNEEILWDVTNPMDDLPENVRDSNGELFQPQFGEKSEVNDSLKEIKDLYKIKRSRKNTNKELQDKIAAAEERYNLACLHWNAKLTILSKRSKITEFKLLKQKAKEAHSLTHFYQKYFMDWRGRYYNRESFLSFMGNDAARSLMQFEVGKTVTEDGLFYLAVHTANSLNLSFSIEELKDIQWTTSDYVQHLESEGLDNISLDKMTLQDRAAYVVEFIHEWIEKVNQRDVTLFKDCEKPLVAMACCIEWRDIFAANDAGEEHFSHLPVSIDGSNNGAQWMAGIMKDPEVGALVGLTPVEIPKDFYVAVAKDLIPAHKEWFEPRQMKLKHIRKGITKRASMVRQYAAGADKIAHNMYADCAKEGYSIKYDINMLDCMNLSKKVVKVIDATNPAGTAIMSYLQSLVGFELGTFGYFDEHNYPMSKDDFYELKNTSFELARSSDEEDIERLAVIERTLSKCTRRLVEGNGSKTVSWTTPSGFPVVYEAYQKKKVKAFITIKGVGRIGLVGQIDTEVPNIRKFISGISPNRIHSTDAAHLGLVVNKAVENGILDLGMIHDSFSAHASDMPKLLEITKDTFTEILSTMTLESWRDEMITDKHDQFDVETPELGDLDVTQVKDSNYFFC